jgi:hypothetical protein
MMGMSGKEMAPRVLQHPGTRPTERMPTVDEHRIPLASDPFYAACRPEQDQYQEGRRCFYCLEGWIFLGSLDHDGEEVIDIVRCRRCGGTGKL